MTNDAWKKLREQVAREQKRYRGAGSNKDGRLVATTLVTAYDSVLRMMDEIEKTAAMREP